MIKGKAKVKVLRIKLGKKKKPDTCLRIWKENTYIEFWGNGSLKNVESYFVFTP